METNRRSKLLATVLVAGAVLAVALVAAVVVSFVTGGDDPKEGSTAPTTATANPEPPAPTASDAQPETAVDPTGRRVTLVESRGGDPLPQSGEPGRFPGDGEMVGAPAGLELQRVSSGTTLMVSRSDGPATSQSGVMTGYAHSAGGAALVTSNYIGLGIEMGAAYADFMEYYAPGLVAENPGLLDELRTRDEKTGGKALAAAEGFQAPRWFRFGQCDETFCTVEAAMPSVADAVGEVDAIGVRPDEHAVMRVSLRWNGDRWEILSGRTLPPVVELDGSWSRWI